MSSVRFRASLLGGLLLLQVLVPTAMAIEPRPVDPNLAVDMDPMLLATFGITPSGELAEGWFESGEGPSVALAHRTAGLVAPEDWAAWTGETVPLSGWYVLSTTWPVDTGWLPSLRNAGIECFSFLPPASFHCNLNGVDANELLDLEVTGIVRFAPSDRVSEALLSTMMDVDGPIFANVMLAGIDLPSPLPEGVTPLVHNDRFATFLLNSNGLVNLLAMDGIEWVEERPVFHLMNSKGRDIMNVSGVSSTSGMTPINMSWNGLDGSGVIVAVADTGLDNGVNNSNMHPDFADHIVDVVSFPVEPATCSYYSLPSCNDGAADEWSGHGTHVAGSVLGDGTFSSGNIVGAAPEARLYFQAIETEGTIGGSTDGYLLGIPSDLYDLFEPAYDNGSRVHTNSWGSDVNGAYTTNSARADASAVAFWDMAILFAAANSGTDANSDGEIDLDSLGAPATAKNVITVGASENDRPTINAAWGSWWPSDYPSNPISSDKIADDPEGMAAFSSRGPTNDGRLKPDVSAPGTFILSTKSRQTTSNGWMAGPNSSYTYMGGTSMATPLTAGATALLLQHLMDNVGHAQPSSALVKAILAASAMDMAGQYSSSTNGAGETAPNNHEGWGRVDMWTAVNASFVDNESVSTDDERAWSFNVPAGAPEFRVALAWTDPASTPSAFTHLVNDLDLAVKDPSGTWTNLSNNVDNLRGLTFSSPSQGTWEVHVLGTNVPSGPQMFALTLSENWSLTNTTIDSDLDGVEDDEDGCPNLAGTSTEDRDGCPDTDGDGYSNPDVNWSMADGADAFPSDPSQWADADFDGYGDNAGGTTPDACTATAGNSSGDRYGCIDSDGDGWSDPDAGWSVENGADACETLAGPSWRDRPGCADEDGDGASDPDTTGATASNGSSWDVSDGADAYLGDATQWTDSDGDGYGDNPPPATNGDGCPSVAGASIEDRLGCPDADGDGWSDPDAGWTVNDGADAFPSEASQWTDQDGDGYGDNASGTNPDACPTVAGTSTENNRLGCLDGDGDGWADVDDVFPTEISQWADSDGDGYGDNPAGVNADACPSTNGNSDEDRLGCTDSDGDGWSDADVNWTAANGADLWPTDATQWADIDGDGYGDNPAGTAGDACPSTAGNSSVDRRGCPDSDGDGRSDPDAGWTALDGADAFPSDGARWADTDGDGWDDTIDDACPLAAGDSSQDRMGCPDRDGDGYSDPDGIWTVADGADAFTMDGTQWADQDGDGYGDNASGTLPDACPTQGGSSWQNGTLGCPDADGDGWADADDLAPNDASQWADADGDGWFDNSGGTMPDACPFTPGNSTAANRYGCPDRDGDGWDDSIDILPDTPSQWSDQDGDGYGDNATGPTPDACPGTSGTSTIDRFGCPDADGDGVSDLGDAFPNDPTRDADSDADGVDDSLDGCPTLAGTSTAPLVGCPDEDGDGVAEAQTGQDGIGVVRAEDGADAFPNDASQWEDGDGDGYGDNASGLQPDACPSVAGTSTIDRYGCPDRDGDGASDEGDEFPDDETQIGDSDGDGFGDLAAGEQPDACPGQAGTSTLDRYGCPDSDGDGQSDDNDPWPTDPLLWSDGDEDGWADQGGSSQSDDCPLVAGSSSHTSARGCMDTDRDGWADSQDAFPELSSQQVDSDGDGYGDNSSLGAESPDHWPSDASRNVAEASLSCSVVDGTIDLAYGDRFSFTCTVEHSMAIPVTARLMWDGGENVFGGTRTQTIVVQPDENGSTLWFQAEVAHAGTTSITITAHEPGSLAAMDAFVLTVEVEDSRGGGSESARRVEWTAASWWLDDQRGQVALGQVLLILVLLGTLVRTRLRKQAWAEEREALALAVIERRRTPPPSLETPPAPQGIAAFDNGASPPPPGAA